MLSSYESQSIINSDLLSKSLTTLIRLLQGFHVVVLVLIMNYSFSLVDYWAEHVPSFYVKKTKQKTPSNVMFINLSIQMLS